MRTSDDEVPSRREPGDRALTANLRREASGQLETVRGPAGRSRRRRWLLLVAVLSLVVAFLCLSCALFVWPSADRPEHVDAVLSLNGANENLREQRALALVRAGYANALLFSEGHYPQVPCPKVPHVAVVCFIPNPARTVGEVEFAVRYAARRGWHSIMVVPGLPQATRARLLMARCFKGHTVVVPAAAPPLFELVGEVIYEWAAMAKALVVDRGC